MTDVLKDLDERAKQYSEQNSKSNELWSGPQSGEQPTYFPVAYLPNKGKPLNLEQIEINPESLRKLDLDDVKNPNIHYGKESGKIAAHTILEVGGGLWELGAMILNGVGDVTGLDRYALFDYSHDENPFSKMQESETLQTDHEWSRAAARMGAFVGMFVGVGKFTAATKWGQTALQTRWGQMGMGAFDGAVTDFMLTKVTDENISNIFKGTAFENIITNYLSTNESDSIFEKKMKAVQEGMLLGAAMDATIYLVKATRRYRIRKKYENQVAQGKIPTNKNGDIINADGDVIVPKEVSVGRDFDPTKFMKNLQSAEDVDLFLGNSAEWLLKWGHNVKKVKTHKEAAEEARKVNENMPDAINDFLKREQTDALNETETEQAWQIMDYLRAEIYRLGLQRGRMVNGVYVADDLGEATADVQDEINTLLKTYYAFASKFAGWRATSGRALAMNKRTDTANNLIDVPREMSAGEAAKLIEDNDILTKGLKEFMEDPALNTGKEIVPESVFNRITKTGTDLATMNILTGAGTHLVNAGMNFSINVWGGVETTFAAAISAPWRLHRLARGDNSLDGLTTFTDAGYEWMGMYAGIVKGWKNLRFYISGEHDKIPDIFLQTSKDEGKAHNRYVTGAGLAKTVRAMKGESPFLKYTLNPIADGLLYVGNSELASFIAKVAEGMTYWPMHALRASDTVFKSMAYEQALWRMASQEHRKLKQMAAGGDPVVVRSIEDLIENPTAAMHEYAGRFAEKQTMTQAQQPMSAPQILASAIDNNAPIFRLVLPFINTPANIMTYTLNRFAPTAVLGQLRWGKIAPANLRQEMLEEWENNPSQVLGRITAASTLMGSMFFLSESLQIHGDGENMTDNQKRAFRDAGGVPRSVKINDTFYRIDNLEPLGSFILFAANMRESWTKVQTAHEQYPSVMSEFMHELGDLTVGSLIAMQHFLKGGPWLKDVNDFIGAMIDGDEKALTRLVQDQMGKAVPTGWAKLQQTEFKQPWDQANTLLEEIMFKFYKRLGALPVKTAYDVYGRPRENNPMSIISPIGTSKYKATPVETYMIEKLDMSVSRAPKKIGGYKLDFDQRQNWLRLRGAPPIEIDGIPMPPLLDRLNQLYEMTDPVSGKPLKESNPIRVQNIFQQEVARYNTIATQLLRAKYQDLDDEIKRIEKIKQGVE